MFDIGFGKLALIAVVALLVLGPERLPRVARTAGALIRRARNSWSSVRAEIERELATDDLKRSIREAAEAVDIRADVQNAANAIHDAVRPSRSTSERANESDHAPDPAEEMMPKATAVEADAEPVATDQVESDQAKRDQAKDERE